MVTKKYLARIGFAVLAGLSTTATAEYVIPQIGGGQTGMALAPMKHVDISLVGNGLWAKVDDSVPTPQLRPLEPAHEFDPNLTWSVLSTKAYNFQYGWNPDGFISLPAEAWIWIDQLDATPGLEVYQRPPASPAYEPIFGTTDSPSRWRWTGAMAHNVYAVDDPIENLYEAVYRVYVGHDITGEPLSGYTSTEATFQFFASPEIRGDYDKDGDVDAHDFAVWQEQFGLTGDRTADGNRDHLVNAADYTVWQDHLNTNEATLASMPLGVPEPASCLLIVGLLAAVIVVLPYRRSKI